jgi:hypothetical protein
MQQFIQDYRIMQVTFTETKIEVMKNKKQIFSGVMFVVVFVLFGTIHSKAQDTTVVKTDSTTVATDSAMTTTVSTTTPTTKPPKPKSTFIIYAGPNVSSLNAESKELDTKSQTGYHIGVSWRTQGFFYGQFGIRYNNPIYNIRPAGRPDSGDTKFSINSLDFPFTGGINILNATDKVLNLRGFISAMPSFTLDVGDNDYGYDKEKVNDFVFHGQVGLGADILFLVFEVGYNYGFGDLIKDTKSKPGQGFLNIGVRF